MITRSFEWFVALLAALALAFAAPPATAAEAGGATAFVQARQAQVSALLKQPPGPARDKQIAAILDGMLDYEVLAKRSLATHWDSLADAQRKEFTDVLKKLVQRNYEKNLKSTLDYDVAYLGEEGQPDGGAIVKTRVKSKTNGREEPIQIDYRLHKSGEAWRVGDIITEGSSLVGNYKNQFGRIIQKDGFDALLKKMKDKLAKEQAA